MRILRVAKRISRFYLRRKLGWAQRVRIKKLNETIDAVKERSFDLDKTSFESSKLFCNIALFLLIADKDISSIKVEAMTHPDPWTRGVLIRTMLITVHEMNIGKVTGRAFRESFRELELPEAVRDRAFIVLKEINKTHARISKSFSSIRNNVIGHRDSDAIKQYKMIKYIDEQKILEEIGDFYTALDEFHGILAYLIGQSGSLKSLAKQYVASSST